MPFLLVQPELISSKYKEQRGISKRRGHLLHHWLRIYSYLQPSLPQRIGMRRLCRLFNAVERFITENSRHSTLMLRPIPSGTWTTFPHVNHHTLEDLVSSVNRMVEESPDSVPRLLFLQEGAPGDGIPTQMSPGTRVRCRWRSTRGFFYKATVASLNDDGTYAIRYEDGDQDASVSLNRLGNEDDGRRDYNSLTGACVVVDEEGCFRLTGENITDDDVLRVAREHPTLQSLNLEGCVNITDASVGCVGRGCPNLQSLQLDKCSNITDAGLTEVGKDCSNLQSLNLTGCSSITDASLGEVARGCSNLQALSLHGCENITDATVAEVSRGCSNLQVLNLYGCKKITDTSLAILGKECPKLYP